MVLPPSDLLSAGFSYVSEDICRLFGIEASPDDPVTRISHISKRRIRITPTCCW